MIPIEDLYASIERNDVKKVRLLLTHPQVDPSTGNNEALMKASRCGHVDVIRLLLTDVRVDPTARDNAAIKIASKSNFSDVVRLLLADRRIDPAAGDNAAIGKASKHGAIDVVRILLTYQRVDPSANNNYAIRQASVRGHIDVVRLLLTDARVDPSADDNGAILWATIFELTDVVRLLVSHYRLRDFVLGGRGGDMVKRLHKENVKYVDNVREKIILISRGLIQKGYPLDSVPGIVVDSLSPEEIDRGISLFREWKPHESNIKNARVVVTRVVGTVNKILGERVGGDTKKVRKR
jgi:ankyrin repeat protein